MRQFNKALNNAYAEKRAFTLLPHASTPWIKEAYSVNF